MSDILLGKLATEFKTVKAMVEVYCHDHHGKKVTCAQNVVSCLNTQKFVLTAVLMERINLRVTSVRFTVINRIRKSKCVW